MMYRQRLEQVEAWQWDGSKEGFLGRPHWVPYCEDKRVYLVVYNDQDNDSLTFVHQYDWLVQRHDGKIMHMDNETFIRKYERMPA